jgi:hypothetical protein
MDDKVFHGDFLMPPTPALGLRIPHDAAEWLKAKAQVERRSLAFIVTELIRAEMAREARAKKAKRS